MPARISDGGERPGGIVGYPLAELQEEVAFIAYHFHWPHDQIMALEHADRRQWVNEISNINRHINGEQRDAYERTTTPVSMS